MSDTQINYGILESFNGMPRAIGFGMYVGVCGCGPTDLSGTTQGIILPMVCDRCGERVAWRFLVVPKGSVIVVGEVEI